MVIYHCRTCLKNSLISCSVLPSVSCNHAIIKKYGFLKYHVLYMCFSLCHCHKNTVHTRIHTSLCPWPLFQFLSVEEPVRRKCRTISLTDPNVVVRGFQLRPSGVDFGTLQEGTSSTVTVVMKNVGVDTCR